MNPVIESILEDVLRREGSRYTDDPVDGGGPTRWGITQATLSAWRGVLVSPEDVACLHRDEALAIYRDRYVRPFWFVEDPELLGLLVDCAVNHGVRRATQWLQAATGELVVDGVGGPKTRLAVQQADPPRLYQKVLAERARFYGRLISDNPLQARFAAGWMRRLAEFIDQTGRDPGQRNPPTSQAPGASS